MKSIQCPSCGAPIRFEDDAVVTECGHCGSSIAPTQYLSGGAIGGGRGRHRVDVDLTGLRKTLSPGRALGCFAAVMALIFGIGGLVFWRGFTMQKSVRSSIEKATEGFVRPGLGRAGEGPIPVARLAEPAFAGRHPLAAAPPPGGLGAIDPVAGLPWALALAQVWHSDVKLERIDVERLRPDGTVNVQDDPAAGVTYRFVSPSRFQALRERANLEADPKGDHEFWIQLEKGGIAAYELSSHAAFATDDEAAEIAALTWPKSLALARILENAAGRPGFPEVPFYKGYLIRLEREGWCWYLSTLSGSPSIPRVRASDGRVWPY
jgi:hypothetical protein